MRIPTPLTVSRINTAKHGSGRFTMCDGGARGLYLVLSPRPSVLKAWEYRYRSPVTKRATGIKLGEWPAMGIPDARRARDEQAALVARGLDPAHERRRTAELANVTLEGAARLWDASRAGQVDERTRATAMDRLRLHVFPALGARTPVSLTPKDIVAALDPLALAGKRETANRTAAVLDQVFAWLGMRGEVASNPAKLAKGAFPKSAATHFSAIVDPAAFGGLLRAVDGYSGFVVRQALRFLALTFVRSGELRGALWSELTLDGPEPAWVIPAERMKVRANGDHVVPLARQAVAILSELRPLTERGAHVFPGLRHGKTLSDATLNAALTTLGFGSDVHRSHGFRSSASTMLNELAAREGYARWNPETIEAQLAHRSKDAVRAAYARNTWAEQRRVMMQAWADECDRMRALGKAVAA